METKILVEIEEVLKVPIITEIHPTLPSLMDNVNTIVPPKKTKSHLSLRQQVGHDKFIAIANNLIILELDDDQL